MLTTIGTLEAKVLDLENKLADQQFERGQLISNSMSQTVTKLLIRGILAGETGPQGLALWDLLLTRWISWRL